MASSMTDVLRDHVAAAGVSCRQIAREAGVQQASLVRFMRGEQSLRLDKADRLAAYFGLELTKRKER